MTESSQQHLCDHQRNLDSKTKDPPARPSAHRPAALDQQPGLPKRSMGAKVLNDTKARRSILATLSPAGRTVGVLAEPLEQASIVEESLVDTAAAKRQHLGILLKEDKKKKKKKEMSE